ncbi:hypothetical protein D083_2838 [Dickeya solani RNS 08.23.3.1.A]|nr:hypothetical protein D083_2838 [Dickeya solani RNS 08.23.3.1.A]
MKQVFNVIAGKSELHSASSGNRLRRERTSLATDCYHRISRLPRDANPRSSVVKNTGAHYIHSRYKPCLYVLGKHHDIT